MRRSLLGIAVTAVAAGCYNPNLSDGGPCATDDNCLEASSCQAGTCVRPGGSAGVDGGTITGSNPDLDGDGVPNGSDDCPDVANADQADDDGDARGNACDSCPFLADTGADADGDGLADACDPDPAGTAPDAMWLQNGFSAALPAGYHPIGWTSSAEMIQVQAGNGESSFSIPLSNAGRSFDHFALSIGVTVASVTATTVNSPEADIGFSVIDPGSEHEIDCVLSRGGGFEPALALFDSTGSPDVGQPYPWAFNTRYILEVVVQPPLYTCNLFDASQAPLGPPLQSVTGPFDATPDGTTIAIWAYRTTAQIDWLFAAGKAP